MIIICEIFVVLSYPFYDLSNCHGNQIYMWHDFLFQFFVGMATERIEKRIKKEEDTKESEDNNDADVISNLPEEVLLRILSLVPTKSAVKTSVLSKRWELLWARVPSFKARSSNYRNKIVFNKLMDKYSHHRRYTNESVTDFALFTEYHGAQSRVDNWL